MSKRGSPLDDFLTIVIKIRDEKAIFISLIPLSFRIIVFEMNAKCQAEGEAGEILQCHWLRHFANKIVRQKVENVDYL